MWDTRYAEPGYLFGTEPARFLQDQAEYLPARGRVLAVADGEGRNSVFLAKRGLDVTAFDASPVAVDKAKSLAAERCVSINVSVASVEEWNWGADTFDAVVAVFIQFADPPLRTAIFENLVRTLKTGGTLMLHGYRPEQLAYGTGGPPQVENLYTEDLLREAFANLRIERLTAYDREIEEGTGHSGMSALIDLVAFKV